MMRWMVVLLMLSGLLVACEKEYPASPELLVEEVVTAARTGDHDPLHALVPSRDEMVVALEAAGLSQAEIDSMKLEGRPLEKRLERWHDNITYSLEKLDTISKMESLDWETVEVIQVYTTPKEGGHLPGANVFAHLDFEGRVWELELRRCIQMPGGWILDAQVFGFRAMGPQEGTGQ